jgi:mRNA interferase YafQ
MYTITATTKFKKDLKLSVKRGLKINLIDEVVLMLENDGNLPTQYKPHILKGNYKGYWECHIQPDWLLIWDQNEEIRLITLLHTGTHSDLF